MPTPAPVEIHPHIWGRNTDNPTPGAVIRLGRRDLFIPQSDLGAAIDRLRAIHAVNA